MSRAKRTPLRVPLPDPAEVVLIDAYGRPVRGRTATIRRLYRDERCNADELAAYFGIGRSVVSYALRNKAADAHRRRGFKTHGRGLVILPYSRDPITRAFRRWLRAA